MVDAKTVPVQMPAVPVKTLQVQVTRGVDLGLQKTVDTDVLSIGTALGNDLVLADPTVSRFHLELRRRGDSVLVRDLGSTNGTIVREGVLREGTVSVSAGSTVTLGQSELRVGDGGVVMVEPPQRADGSSFIGQSAVVRRLLSTVTRVAKSDASVLLLGESGTGKELLAQEIHRRSPRANKPFVVVDCGALTPTLFASELFGHEKGAFTSADARHEGAFERAEGGTLLLDEVGELPAALQVALLGALERRSIRRVGGRTDLPVNVRVLAATHRNLRSQVNTGTFRLDLFYRLAVVSLEAPPLRERREDIRALLEHFLALAGSTSSLQTTFPPEALVRLEAHDWPGNVRELRNVVVSSVALGEPQPPGEDALSSTPDAPASSGELVQSYRDARAMLLREFERTYLSGLLKRSGGNVRQAARDARMDRSYLVELLRRHGLG